MAAEKIKARFEQVTDTGNIIKTDHEPSLRPLARKHRVEPVGSWTGNIVTPEPQYYCGDPSLMSLHAACAEYLTMFKQAMCEAMEMPELNQFETPEGMASLLEQHLPRDLDKGLIRLLTSYASSGNVLSILDECEAYAKRELQYHPGSSVPSGREFYQNSIQNEALGRFYDAIMMTMRGNFGLRHERPRKQFFKETAGVVILGNSSVFIIGHAKKSIVSELIEMDSDFVALRIPKHAKESLGEQYERAMKLSESFQGSECMVKVDGVWKFTKKIIFIIYQCGWDFCVDNKIIDDKILSYQLDQAYKFAEWGRRHGASIAYVQPAPAPLIWPNCGRALIDSYDHTANRIAAAFQENGAVMIPAVRYNTELMQFNRTGNYQVPYGNCRSQSKSGAYFSHAFRSHVLAIVKLFYY